MKRSLTPLCLLSLTLGLITFAGCGDSEPDTVAQAPASSGSPSKPSGASGGGEDGDGESYSGGSYGGGSYGGEGDGEESGGGSYGAGNYGGEEDGEDMYGGGYPGGGYGGGDYGAGTNSSNGKPSVQGMGTGGEEEDGGYGSYGGPGYAGGPGYGGGEPGYGGEEGAGMYGGYGQGGGLGGQPGGPPMNFASVNQFLIQNCSQCHMRGQEKGGVSLASMSREVVDGIELWEKVSQTLETGEMPPRGRPQPNPAQKQKVLDWIRTSIAEAAEAKKDLIATAERYFSRGKEAKAVQLMMAHIASAPQEQAAEALQQVQWYPRGKKPTLALRFAVAVNLDAPSTLTDVKPIGVEQGGGGGGGGFGGSISAGRGRGGATQTRKRSFESLTGEFGSSVAAAFMTRWSEGKMGTMLNEIEAVEDEPAPAGGMGGYGGSYGSGGYGSGEGAGVSAPGLAGGYGGEDGGGGFGNPGYGGEGGGYGDEGSGGSAVATIETGPTFPGEALLPGLLYLGEGDVNEIKERASDAQVDAVFLFEIEASRNNRNGLVNNATRVRIMTPAGDVIGSSRTLKNTEVQMARARGNDDGLEKNVERLFMAFDKELALAPMPTVPAAAAQGRMALILSDDSIPALQKMFEARLYHSMSALTDEELSMAYQIVLDGNEGQSLAAGTPDDKQLVIEMALEKMDVL